MPFVVKRTLSETWLERTRVTPDAPSYQFKPTYPAMGPVNQWRTVSFQEFFEQAEALAHGLMGAGLQPGDRLAIVSNTRYEWILADMACLGTRGVTVPIYPTAGVDDMAYVVGHLGAKIIVAESGLVLERLRDAQERFPSEFSQVKRILTIEPSGDHPTVHQLIEEGRKQNTPQVVDHLRAAQPQDLIGIWYTSGTTARPKGVMISHDNMVSVMEDLTGLIKNIIRPETEVLLSLLPVAHILGKVESAATFVFGFKQAIAENLEMYPANMKEIQPSLIVSVPRLFEKAYQKICEKMEVSGGMAQRLFNLGIKVSRVEAPTLVEKAQLVAADQIVFRKIRERFGGKLRFTICGGAPLAKDVGDFFQSVGIQVLEGYGLTETTGPIAINLPDHPRFGTVGKPLKEVAIKIADDGEILVKSRKVFQGYYQQPDDTALAIGPDGWFHTGDIGRFDEEGCLKITDRKKDLIVTSTGENVAPQKIEARAIKHRVIRDFAVCGDRRKYLTALITLTKDEVIRYATENHVLFSQYSDLVQNPRIQSLVQKLIDDINSGLAGHETIKKFVILPTEFTVESGELTSSLKMRRGFIQHKFAQELESMYTAL